MWLAHANVCNPEINKETKVVSAKGVCESWAQNPSQMWGPQGLLMWGRFFWLAALHQETRASRGQVWQLKADFIPAVVALPTQVEWTDLLHFPFLHPEGMNLHILEPNSPICSHITQPSLRCSIILHRKQSWTDESLASAPGGDTPFVQRSELTRNAFWFQIFLSCVLGNETNSEFWSSFQHKHL